MARLDKRVAAAVLLVAALATQSFGHRQRQSFGHISLQNLAQAGRDEGKKEEAGKAIDPKYADQEIEEKDEEKSEKKSGKEIGAADAVGSNHEEKSDSEVRILLSPFAVGGEGKRMTTRAAGKVPGEGGTQVKTETSTEFQPIEEGGNCKDDADCVKDLKCPRIWIGGTFSWTSVCEVEEAKGFDHDLSTFPGKKMATHGYYPRTYVEENKGKIVDMPVTFGKANMENGLEAWYIDAQFEFEAGQAGKDCSPLWVSCAKGADNTHLVINRMLQGKKCKSQVRTLSSTGGTDGPYIAQLESESEDDKAAKSHCSHIQTPVFDIRHADKCVKHSQICGPEGGLVIPDSISQVDSNGVPKYETPVGLAFPVAAGGPSLREVARQHLTIWAEKNIA